MSAVEITPAQLSRRAAIYIRQFTSPRWPRTSRASAVSTASSNGLSGWAGAVSEVLVIDDDLGVSGSGVARTGFDRLVAEVGLGRIGAAFSIEVSRLARNNRDWYHLLDICALMDTLIADADGIYHPGAFNDRLLLVSKAP